MSAPRDPLLFVLGLCARARKLVVGTPMVCEALRKGGKARARKLVVGTPMVCEALRKGGKAPVLAVLEAADTSDNTHGKLTSKCAYYHTPLYRIHVSTEVLAHAIGKSGATAAVGVTDAGLYEALRRHLPPAEVLPPVTTDEDTDGTPD